MRNLMDAVEQGQRSWELSKYSDAELAEELELRARLEVIRAAEAKDQQDTGFLYANKDVIDYDDVTGQPFLTEER